MWRSELSRRTVLWLIPVLFALHNLEEAVAFRHSLPRVETLLPTPLRRVAPSLSYSAILGALVVVSGLAFLLTVVAVARPASRGVLWALLALEAAVALNVVAHLVSAVAVFHGYAPGLVTAVSINAPFALYCFRRARRERWVSATALWVTIPASLVLHGPILLAGLWLADRAVH